MDKICETCNKRLTKKKNGKYFQMCLSSARNHEKLKGSGYYKDYYQNNKEHILQYKKEHREVKKEWLSEKYLAKYVVNHYVENICLSISNENTLNQ